MPDQYLSLTELGKLYGVSRNKVGLWLVEVGLRTADKKPSRLAFAGGFVRQEASTQPGTYFWIWHADKTRSVLEAAGYRASLGAAAQKQSPATGGG
jgi:hypothetical protein